MCLLFPYALPSQIMTSAEPLPQPRSLIVFASPGWSAEVILTVAVWPGASACAKRWLFTVRVTLRNPGEPLVIVTTCSAVGTFVKTCPWASFTTVVRTGSQSVMLPATSLTLKATCDASVVLIFVAETTTAFVVPTANAGTATVAFTALVTWTDCKPLPVSRTVTVMPVDVCEVRLHDGFVPSPPQIFVAEFDVTVWPDLATNDAWIVSVPIAELVYVNVVTPLPLVTPVPLLPASAGRAP